VAVLFFEPRVVRPLGWLRWVDLRFTVDMAAHYLARRA
jgi:hypothetical protein